MFAYITGKFAAKSPAHVIIDCLGVGYFINISLNTYSKIQEINEGKLHTYFHVREDAQILYGFAEEHERDIFTHLISVSGIGPNTARMILSYTSPHDLQEAIMREDVKLLTRIKGVGEKTAKRLILELKDKVGKGTETSIISSSSHNNSKNEALSALVMLGFAKVAAEKALDKVNQSAAGTLSVEEMIKLALKQL